MSSVDQMVARNNETNRKCNTNANTAEADDQLDRSHSACQHIQPNVNSTAMSEPTISAVDKSPAQSSNNGNSSSSSTTRTTATSNEAQTQTMPTTLMMCDGGGGGVGMNESDTLAASPVGSTLQQFYANKNVFITGGTGKWSGERRC